MGLDMYLEADISLWSGEKDPRAEKVRKLVEFEYAGLPDGENHWIGGSLTVPLAYWRKVNAVHAWFVKNVQDGADNCDRSYVTVQQLQQLKALCQQVVGAPSQAAKLLPTQSGFFFGETDYDDYYFEQLKYTIDVIDRIEKFLPPYAEIYYTSSW